jgi:hypothetical protein
MVEIIKLVRTDFDNVGSHLCKNDIAIFVGDEKAHASEKFRTYLDAMAPLKLYYGWDGEVYPKFNTYVLQSTEIRL